MLPSTLRRLLKWRLRLAEFTRPAQGTLLLAAFVGFLGALVAVLFRVLAYETHALVTGHAGEMAATAALLPWWQRLVTPIAGGLVAGLVIHYGMRLARGAPTTDFMEAVVLGDGVVRARPSLVKSVSALAIISCGGSIGREGPMAQLASMMASLTGRLFRLSKPQLRLLVACGAAAGIAAAYNAPIAGALFVAEIILGSIAMESFGPLILASVVSTVTARQFFGGSPIYSTPHFQLVSPWELPAYLVLGLGAGLIAPLFLRLLWNSERLFRLVRGPAFVRLALGGVVVGALSIYVPHVWGNGYSVVSSVLVNPWTSALLFQVLVFKLVATAATVGSGAVGGVFTPTLFVGAVVGSLYGEVVHELFPGSSAGPGAYALVGMGGLLAGTTHAPLMAILMLFEMTLDYDIVLPLMLACVTSYYASRSISKRSIYSESLRRKEEEEEEPPPIAELRVRDLAKPVPVRVRTTERFTQIAEKFVSHRNNYLFVTDDEGRLRGAIELHDVKGYLNEQALAGVVIASDLMHADVPAVTLDATLQEALERFSSHQGERLPVIRDADSRELVGSISKTDLLLTLAHGQRRRERPKAAA